jgi:MFS family permease
VDGRAQRDQLIINAAAFLRSLGVGLMGVVLGIYLSRIGFSAFRIGAVVAVGLAGSAVATTVVSFAADKVGLHRSQFHHHPREDGHRDIREQVEKRSRASRVECAVSTR